MEVNRCINVLKDIYQNIPEDDRYESALGIVTERLSLEFDKLMPLSISACRQTSIDDKASTNGNAANKEMDV